MMNSLLLSFLVDTSTFVFCFIVLLIFTILLYFILKEG